MSSVSNFHRSPHRRNLKNVPLAAYILLSTILLHLFQCKYQNDNNYLFFPLTRETQIYMDYAGVSLLNKSDLNPIQLEHDFNRYSTEIRKIPDRPGIDFMENRLCFTSQSKFYFEHEAGLRFMYCDTGLTEQVSGIINILNTIYRALKPTAYPVYQYRNVFIGVTGLDDVRKDFKILATVDGNTAKPLLIPERIEGKIINYQSHKPLNKESISQNPLPRRFPAAVFHLLVVESGVVLLYRLPESSSRFLKVYFKSKDLSNAVLKGLQKIHFIQQKLILEAETNPVYASEVYFREQGNVGQEFAELASDHITNISEYKIYSDSEIPYRLDTFMFARSVLLLSKETDASLDIRHSLRLLYKDTIDSISLSELRHMGAGRQRTYRRTGPGENLSPSIYCLNQNPCGSAGIHPYYAKMLENLVKNEDQPYCTLDDYSLNEINPLGISREAKLNTGGKFLEIVVKRKCRSGIIVFVSENFVLEPPHDEHKQGDIILFVANASLFSVDGQQQNTALRRLTSKTRVRAIDLETGANRIIFKGFAENVRLIYGQQDQSEDNYLFRVHSLIPEPDSSFGLVYHPAITSGLRPDITLHAMSPGFKNDISPYNAAIKLAEVLPTGSYNSSGISHPGDEFIEFIHELPQSPHRQSSLAALTITRLRDQDIRHYLFPVPGSDKFERFLFMKNPAECFTTDTNTIIFSSLYLPNEAANYELFGYDGSLLDGIKINSATYDLLDQNIVRYSLSHISEANIWKISDGTGAFDNHCAGRTGATPGDIESYRPFLLPAGAEPGARYFRLYTENQFEVMEWRAGLVLDTPLFYGQKLLERNGILSVFASPLPPIKRLLLSINLSGETIPLLIGEIFYPAPELFIHTISPTPVVGEVEWLRICTVDGFSPAIGQKLNLKDSGYSDEITTWYKRTGYILPGMNIGFNSLQLQAGECALLVDPDYNSQTLPLLPEDSQLWTIATTAAIGNGLASGEGILIYLTDGGSEYPICSFGLPDSPGAFTLKTATGQQIVRKTDTFYDLPENYRVQP